MYDMVYQGMEWYIRVKYGISLYGVVYPCINWYISEYGVVYQCMESYISVWSRISV